MSRRALLALAWLALGACGASPALPDDDLLVRVSLGTEAAVPGRGFPVTVVRQWSRDLEPEPFEERDLAPLVLRLEDQRRREDGRHVEETRSYRGYAFSLTDVRVPAVIFRARPKDGGPERRTAWPRQRLHVVPEVDAAAPGAPELPGAPLAEPIAWKPPLGAALALLAAVGLLVRGRRRRRSAPAAPAPGPPPVAPEAQALARLAALRASGAPGAEPSEILRDYVEARLGVPAPRRTTEEVLGALAGRTASDDARRTRLADLLSRCDGLKFSARAVPAAERDALIAAAQAFVVAGGETA